MDPKQPIRDLKTNGKSRITREIHAVKKTREFHDFESENISGGSIVGAALINYFVPDAALIRINNIDDKKLLNADWSIKIKLFFFWLCEEGKITRSQLVLRLPSNNLFDREVVFL